jgi:lipid II:glycine glycyltransferase (peptidoglycan interpeptide bridge formation enzyme)
MNIQRVNSLHYPNLATQLSYSGLDSWMNFINNIYGHPVHRFAVLDEGQAVGALSLLEVKHPVFGHYLATAPFSSYGGFAYKNKEAQTLLLDEAQRLAKEINAEYISLRFDDTASAPTSGWVEHPVYFTYLIPLPATSDDLMKRFSSDHRNHIRKSLKKGFSIRFGHLDLLDDAYEALALSMHELGSPYHSKTYLRKMAEYLGETLEFAVTMTQKARSPAAAFLFIKGTLFSIYMPMFCVLPARRMLVNSYIGLSFNMQSKKEFQPSTLDEV